MSETNLAVDQLKSFVRRIESVEDEINALNADKSEIFKEARSNGFDVKQLRKVIQKRSLPADERMEQDTVFELYWDAIHGPHPQADKPRAHAHVENIEEFPAKSAVATLRADPSMQIVDVANLKSKSEHQSAPQAGSDLTSPPSPQGQVATNPVAKADEDVKAGGVDSPSVSSDARSGKTVEAESVSRGGSARTLSATSEVMDATAGETAPIQGASEATEAHNLGQAGSTPAPATKYAAPGEITWETHPPEGVERSPISIAFANMGQDAVLIRDEMERGRAQPIIKQGKVILDGWCRYMTARDMTEMDSSPLAYAVVQYADDDPLIDIIKLNVEGRMLTDEQKRLIAKNLTRLQPNRKAEIYKAFEIFLEPV